MTFNFMTFNDITRPNGRNAASVAPVRLSFADMLKIGVSETAQSDSIVIAVYD
jgi:hypothetical protein